MDCKILEIEETDGLITAAKYLCSVGNIATEGWWYFKDQQMIKPFADVQESDVIEWLIAEAGEGIEANLNRQAQALNQRKSIAPWLPQTFTPSL